MGRTKIYYNDPKKLNDMNSVESHEDRVLSKHDFDLWTKTLDDRERCVISMYEHCRGASHKEIAEKIGVDVKTLRKIRETLKNKHDRFFES